MAMIHCLPRHTSRELDWKWSSWNSYWHSDMRCQCRQQQLNLLCLSAGPLSVSPSGLNHSGPAGTAGLGLCRRQQEERKVTERLKVRSLPSIARGSWDKAHKQNWGLRG